MSTFEGTVPIARTAMRRLRLLLRLSLLAVLFLPAASLRAQAPGAWTSVPANGEAHVRHESAFVQAGDRYYLIGGRGDRPVDVYDPAAGTWATAAPAPIELHHMQAVALDGLIYVAGAFTGGWPHETPVPNLYLYDPVQDRWMVGPEIPAGRRRGAAGAAVHDGRLYVVSGIVDGHTAGWVPWLDVYDPAANTWSTLPDAPRARDHFHAAVADGMLLAAGGRRSGSTDRAFGGTVTAVDVYDLAAGAWRTLPNPLPTGRAGTTATVRDGELLVLGGESDAQELAHDEVEALDLATGTWRAAAPLRTGRHGMQAITNARGTFVAGGSANRGGGPELTALELLPSATPAASVGEPLVPGTLEVDAVERVEAGTARVRVRNTGGNQALVLTYALATGAARVEAPTDFPRILAPGATLDVVVRAAAGAPGELLIKAFRPGSPLVVPLAEVFGER